MERPPTEHRLTALEVRVATLEALQRPLGTSNESPAESLNSPTELAWRSELNRWKVDLVAGLGVAAAELGKLQEEVGLLEDHILALQPPETAPSQPSSLKFNITLPEGSANAETMHQASHPDNGNHASLTSRVCRMESAMVLDMQPMKSDLFDLKARQTSWISCIEDLSRRWEEVSSQSAGLALEMKAAQSKYLYLKEDTTKRFQEASAANASLNEDVQLLKNRLWYISDTSAKLDSKVDLSAWQAVNVDYDAHLKTLRDIIAEARSDFEAWRKQCDDKFANHYSDIRKLLVRAQFP